VITYDIHREILFKELQVFRDFFELLNIKSSFRILTSLRYLIIFPIHSWLI